MFHLRPHKGGIAGKPPHFYAVRGPGGGDIKCETAVVTEAEYKAQALNAVLNFSGPAQFALGALPGTSMSKNEICRAELLAWLKAVGAKRVVVAFDREEKGDPRLASFKPDKRKGHDTQVWARYLAQFLNREGYDAKVAVLPREYQDAQGKADWDGRLAARIAELKGDATEPNEIWPAVAPVIRKEWLAVLSSARKPNEFRGSGVFTDEEERLIQVGLNKLYLRRALPCGGVEELDLAQKLKSLANGSLKDVPGVYDLGEKYRQVVGGYYVLAPLRDQEKAKLGDKRDQAKRDADADLLWFCNLKARGTPKAVSNFRMTCHYVLVKEDGTRFRMVTLENTQGEKTGPVALGARPFTAPRDFREWLANQGNFTWLEGEKELELLQRDLNEEAAFMEVYEVTAYGDHDQSGLTFLDDVAYGPGGEEILPDEHGIVWWGERGYKLSERGSDNQCFRQPKPRMRPAEALVFDGGYKLVKGTADNLSAIQGLFREVTHLLGETLGVCEAYIAIGAFLAFVAARAILREYGAFPGLWITGEKGSGKTTLTSLLMELMGFLRMQSGIGLLRNSSPAGLQIVQEQVSNQPVWLDEFRETEVHPDKRAIIHSAFNRELSSKFAESGCSRKIRTAFIVVGESTTSDAATRSRYAHIHVNRNRRKGDHLPWLQEHRDQFFVFGRFLMRNRPRYIELCLARLSNWLKSPELAGIEERHRLVYGVGYAAFRAMAEMLQSHAAEDLEEFRKELVAQTGAATEEVQSQTDLNQFFEDLLAAFTNGAFGHTKAELQRYFRAERKEAPHPPGAPNQTQVPWVSADLYLKPAVLDVVRRHKYLQHQELRLNQLDLRGQMATKKYWLRPKHRMHRKRFAGKNNEGCWGIDLDFHPMGYHPISDEEWLAQLETAGVPDGDVFSCPKDEWADPRHGELFAIVHKLLAKE